MESAQVAPRPVIALEQETGADVQGAQRALAILASVLAGGAVLSFTALHSLLLSIMLLMLVAALVAVIIAIGRNPQTPPPLPPPIPGSFSSGQMLQYHSLRRQYANESGIRVLPFLGGFFGSLLACAAAFVLLAATLDVSQQGRMLIFLGVGTCFAGLVVLAARLGKRPALSGIGRGVAIGLALGMMALGPCAFCYVLV
jgi:hypothetical protein